MANIKAVGLTKKFDNITAVDSLDLEVQEGEIFGLVGPDGAGKTTTMRLLTGILDPTSGDGWVCGKHIVRESESLKDNIGYMSQRFGLYEDLTVIENINFYADIYCVAGKERTGRIDHLLGFSGLIPFKGRLAGKLSGGMKQKLGLACALIHTPRVVASWSWLADQGSNDLGRHRVLLALAGHAGDWRTGRISQSADRIDPRRHHEHNLSRRHRVGFQSSAVEQSFDAGPWICGNHLQSEFYEHTILINQRNDVGRCRQGNKIEKFSNSGVDPHRPCKRLD